MNLDLNKIIAGMGGLILIFILISRSSDTNTVVNAIGGFVTRQTQALQGVGYGSLIGAPSAGSGIVNSLLG